MALYDLSGKQVTKIPFRKDFELWRGRLSADERAAIDEWMDQRIDGDEIHTAGWMPGSDWRGTVLWPIFNMCAKGNQSLAGRAFGLFVFVRFMVHPGDWVSGRFDIDGRAIGSRTYFRPRAPK